VNALHRFVVRPLDHRDDDPPLDLVAERPSWEFRLLVERVDARGLGRVTGKPLEHEHAEDREHLATVMPPRAMPANPPSTVPTPTSSGWGRPPPSPLAVSPAMDAAFTSSQNSHAPIRLTD
jgi:hypothetical protein